MDYEKVIVITSDDKEENEVIAIFTVPALVKEFLNRPLAKGKKYCVTECILDPAFTTTPQNLYYVMYDPASKENCSVEKVGAFYYEYEANKDIYKVYEDRLFLSVFDDTEEGALYQSEEIYNSLVKTGEWDNLVELANEAATQSATFLKYKYWNKDSF